MRSVFRQNYFKKCVLRIGGVSLQFDTARFKIANFKKRSAKRLAFYVSNVKTGGQTHPVYGYGVLYYCTGNKKKNLVPSGEII